MIIRGGYEIPDRCPKDCKFKDDVSRFGQNSICIRCPVFNCSGDFPLIDRDDFREDWSREWALFFEGSRNEPILKL